MLRLMIFMILGLITGSLSTLATAGTGAALAATNAATAATTAALAAQKAPAKAGIKKCPVRPAPVVENPPECPPGYGCEYYQTQEGSLHLLTKKPLQD